MRGVIRAGWAVALVMAVASSGCGSGDSNGGGEAAPTSTSQEITTTQAPVSLQEASTAQYQRSDGMTWTATMLVGQDNRFPSSQPQRCEFKSGRDAVVPIKLQITSTTQARNFARLVLTTPQGGAAHHPTGHLQSVLGLRSDQRILLDVSKSPEGSRCLDLTYAGHREHPEFGVAGNGSVELEGQLVLVGYLDAKGIIDATMLDALTFRWVSTSAPPPIYQITESGRQFNIKVTSVTSKTPIGGHSGSLVFSLLA